MDYSDSMPSDRQLLNFIVEKDLLNRLDDFRFQNRFATRAGAIKWLLDWALEQGAKPDRIHVHVTAPAPVLPAREELKLEALPAVAPAPPVVSNGKAEPSHESVIQALKAQGYEVGETAVQEGQVRIVVRSTDCSALVTVGKELHELAAGRLSLSQLAARRRGA